MSTRAKTRKNSRRRAYRLKALAATVLTGPMAATGLAVGSQAPARAASSPPAPSTQPGTPVKATPIAAPGGPAAAQAAALAGERCWTTGYKTWNVKNIFGVTLYASTQRVDWCAKNGRVNRYLFAQAYGQGWLGYNWYPPTSHWEASVPRPDGIGLVNDIYHFKWFGTPLQASPHIFSTFYSNGGYVMDFYGGQT